MKIHNLLDDIFSSRSKVRILRLLCRYPEREFTEREMARMIGMSQNTVNVALGDLKRTNLLLYRKIGRANAYNINNNSALYSYLRNIFEREGKIRGDMIKKLKAETKPFISCILFGSFAREVEAYDSDLDLLVIVKDKRKAEVILDRLVDEMLVLYGIPVSMVLLTPRELINKWNAPYMKKVRKDHVLISGKPLEELYGEGDKK